MTAKTHRERAEEAASALLLRTDTYRHEETGEEKTAAALIAQEMFPAELAEAARRYREWSQKVTRASEIPYAVTMGLDAALALYDQGPES